MAPNSSSVSSVTCGNIAANVFSSLSQSSGDFELSEDQIDSLLRILTLGVDIRDRRNRVRTYKNSFVGRYGHCINAFLSICQYNFN